MNPHLAQMKLRLEEVLDEHFPKIYEEGPEKIAVKRGAALMLYGEAMMLAKDAIEKSISDYKKLHCSDCQGQVPAAGKCDVHDGYVDKPDTI